MNLWDWLWAWTRDPEVWEWLRPTGAALLGALVGGLFTLWGQRQSAAQVADRETKAADRVRYETLRDQSREEAHKLFTGFTELHRDIQDSPWTFSQIANGRHWASHWREIWTKDRSLDLDVRARLLTDAETRRQVQKLVWYLDSAENNADGPFAQYGEFRSPLDTNLRYMVEQLSAEGIELLGAYLRGERYETTREVMWRDLAAAETAYIEWEADHFARMEAQAEEQAGAIARAEELT
ncbi:hypothetical protein [Microbacterium sp. NPDC055683]